MAAHPLARLTAAAFVCMLLAAVGAGSAASQERAQTKPPPGLEPLWREYPLEPKGARAELPTPGERPPAVEPEPRPAAQTPQQPQRNDRSGVSTLALVAVTLGVVTVLVLAIVALGVARPALVESVRGRARRRLRPEGGSAMSDVFRRLRRGREEGETPPSREEPTEDRTSALLRAFEPYTVERSTPVESEQPSTDRPEGSGEEPSEGRKPASAADLGEHVAAVIATAQDAAAEMRREAVADADRIRKEASEEAKGLVAEATREAEQMRADASTYSRETRQEADAYAGEKRSEAEAYATSVRADAEENSRHLREAAEEGAKQIEKEARRRREMLIGEAERFEERLHSLHSVFHGITTQLDELLPGQRQSDDEEASRESIEEALRPEASKQA